MFRRRLPISSQQDRASDNKLAGFIRKLQTRWALALSRQDKKLTIRQRKVLVCLFMLLMSGLSTYWICEGIYPEKGQRLLFIPHQTVTVPIKASLPDSLDLNFLRAYQRWRMVKDSLPVSNKR